MTNDHEREYRRRRTAWHEASHAVIRYAISGPGSVDLISCRPSAGSRGMMISTNRPARARIFAAHSANTGPGGFGWSVEARARLEADILVTLAGELGAAYAAPPASGYVGDHPCDQEAAGIAGALARLSPRHRELLHAADAEDAEDVEADDNRARDLSERFSGAEAAAHLAWLHVSAARLVAERIHSIERLALALLACPILEGAAAEAVVASLADRDPQWSNRHQAAR